MIILCTDLLVGAKKPSCMQDHLFCALFIRQTLVNKSQSFFSVHTYICQRLSSQTTFFLGCIVMTQLCTVCHGLSHGSRSCGARLNSSNTTQPKQVQRDPHSARIMCQQTDGQCFSITWLSPPVERNVSFKKLCRFQYLNHYVRVDKVSDLKIPSVCSSRYLYDIS